MDFFQEPLKVIPPFMSGDSRSGRPGARLEAEALASLEEGGGEVFKLLHCLQAHMARCGSRKLGPGDSIHRSELESLLMILRVCIN